MYRVKGVERLLGVPPPVELFYFRLVQDIGRVIRIYERDRSPIQSTKVSLGCSTRRFRPLGR